MIKEINFVKKQKKLKSLCIKDISNYWLKKYANPFYSQISAKHIEVSLFDSKLLSLD